MLGGNRRPTPPPLAWIVFLGVGLAIGAAATLLTGVTGSGGGPSSPGVTVFPDGQLFAWISVAVLFGAIGFLVFDRIRQGAMPVPNRIVVTVLVLLVLLLVFAAVARTVTGGGTPPLGGGTGGTNSTQDQSPGNGTGATTNVTGPGSTIGFFGISVPYWGLFAILAGVLVVVGAVATMVIARRSDRRTLHAGAPTGEIREVLADAVNALAEGTTDPRLVLVELYAGLLTRLRSAIGDVANATAEEIRAQHLVRLGVRPSVAEEITRLFELARYSSHPVGPAEVVRARRALREAIEDLDPRRGLA